MPNRTLRNAAVALAACCGLWPAAALADFRLCNNASTRVSVAVAYTDGRGWVSEGWWNLKAGACEMLLRGPLAAQFYYVYAMDERGGEWKGKSFMCTRDREFRIEGRENCLVRGYRADRLLRSRHRQGRQELDRAAYRRQPAAGGQVIARAQTTEA